MKREEIVEQYPISLHRINYQSPYFARIHQEICTDLLNHVDPIEFYLDVSKLDKLKDGQIAVVMYRSADGADWPPEAPLDPEAALEAYVANWPPTKVYSSLEDIALSIQDCLASRPIDSRVIWRVFERVDDHKAASSLTQGRVYMLLPKRKRKLKDS